MILFQTRDTSAPELSTPILLDVSQKIKFPHRLLIAKSFCHKCISLYFTDITGMTKECLEPIYSEVEEKSQRMNMWKGSRKTKSGKLQDKYLKVCFISYLYLYIPNNSPNKLT